MNVATGMSVLSSTNDLYYVWAMGDFMDDSGKEAQVPGIIEDRDSQSSIEWGLFLQLQQSWYAALWEAHSQGGHNQLQDISLCSTYAMA